MAAAELVALGILATAGTMIVSHYRSGREVVDALARRLPRNANALRRYTDPEHAPVAPEVGPGLALGRDVVGGQVVRQSWEDVAAIIAGARTGKTTTQVAPAILAAPGAVYTCSNKRDVVDLTAEIRGKNAEVWIFDPQGIANGQPTWWWNPLDMATDLAGARNLAGLFAAASRPPGSQRDAYFDPEGEELLAILLLAARLSDQPLTTVYQWLSTGRNDRVVSGLASGGHELAAQALLDVMNQPDKQRAGVFGTARKNVSFLADPNLGDWITERGDDRPRFDTDVFAASSDTLYSLSKEGPGSAGPLTAALTAAVVLSAERLASRSVGGRLAVPMVCPLDEVANVCRWRELPDLYSHYGSRGIILMSFLQSWSQGVDVWGEQGMRKLWGAANIRLYGGGSNEQGFLRRHLVGVRGDGHPPAHHLPQRRANGSEPFLRDQERTDLRRGDPGRTPPGPGPAHGLGYRPGAHPHPECARRSLWRGRPGLLGHGVSDRGSDPERPNRQQRKRRWTMSTAEEDEADEDRFRHRRSIRPFPTVPPGWPGGCARTSSARSSEPSSGARNGGTTPRPSNASRRCGGRGRSSVSMAAPG